MARELTTAKPGHRSEKEQIVADVRDRLSEAWDHDKDNRDEGARDLAFLAGDQWPDAVKREREASRRPMLTINRLPQFLRQVTNDIRQADLSIKVSPVDDRSDPELAKIYNGLLRQIQYQSSASHVFATAAEHQSGCGIGWFRVVTQYMDDSAFEQEIKLRAIPHPFSVYCDPAAVLPDRSDAIWMIVTELVPTATFKARYPKAAVESVDVSSANSRSSLYWTTSDAVRIAEYWVKEPYTKVLGLTEAGETIDLTDIKPADRVFLPPIVRERKQTAYKVKQYLVSGTEILDGPNEWAGKHIPIVPVIGSEVPLENKTLRYGLIRFARDPQTLYNYYRTATAEMIALAPKSPYLVTTGMIGDKEIKPLWDTANTANRPYLPYKVDPAAPNAVPRREHPPEMPAALVQEAQIASEDMKATTGIYDAGLGRRSNETSGRAILARQHEGDVANYHYADNLHRALEHCGRILIDLIPHVYDTERVIRIMQDDDTEEYARVNAVQMSYDGVPTIMNDLSAGRFDVRVTIGKSYSTKRIESADSLMQFMQAVPDSAQVIADLVAKNMDWPGSEEIAKRLKNAVPAALLVDPDDPNSPGPPPPPDPLADPMARAEMTAKLAQARKAIADARKVEMETAAMFSQPMLQPEPPLPPVEQFAPQQQGGPMPPDMQGMEQDIDPAALEAMMQGAPMGLPPGPSQPLPFA